MALINTRVSEKRQRAAIKHELRHLAFNHMWVEEKPIEEIEDEADNGKGVKFGPNYAWVELPEKELPAGVYRAEKRRRVLKQSRSTVGRMISLKLFWPNQNTKLFMIQFWKGRYT